MLMLLNQVLNKLDHEAPAAYAYLQGRSEKPDIKGIALFYSIWGGTLVSIIVNGLPDDNFLGMHIHEGASCTGTKEDPFADVGGHFNPAGKEHPFHAGDLPSLLENDGFAFQACFTARFQPWDVMGRTIIIHGKSDDFKSQPAGDSGMKIACGEIVKN